MVTADYVAFNVRLSPELYESVRRYAYEQRLKQAEVIRLALTEFLDKRERPDV